MPIYFIFEEFILVNG